MGLWRQHATGQHLHHVSGAHLLLVVVYDIFRIGGPDDARSFLELGDFGTRTFTALDTDRYVIALEAFHGGFFMTVLETIFGRRIFQQRWDETTGGRFPFVNLIDGGTQRRQISTPRNTTD